MQRLVVPFSISPCAPAVAHAVHSLRGLTMGTRWSVKFTAPAARSLNVLQAGIEQQLNTVIAQMSTWESDSNLSRYNQADPGTWHSLPLEFFRVVKYALSVAEATAGAFDPTAGPLVNLWGFGPESAQGRRPERHLLEATRARVGWEKIKLDPSTQHLLQPGGVYLDLSAIAKGFAVDQLAQHLQQCGVENFLVEIGGELRGAGVKPDARPWWVSLEHPPSSNAQQQPLTDTVIALHGLSVATSGDYRRYFTATENDSMTARHYSHTIDPRSGEPIEHGLAAVTVIHTECMAADALSTALNVMGAEPGMQFAARHSLAARFITRTPTGLHEQLSPAFMALMQ